MKMITKKYICIKVKTYFVSADRHGHDLGLESSGDFRYLDLGADGLVGFHVEALHSVGTIDFGHELKMAKLYQTQKFDLLAHT